MASTPNHTIQELAENVQLYVLLGPPGTGKTTDLEHQVQQAVGIGWQVLIASLTRAAAREIAGRDLDIDPRRVGTLHAHAYHALGGPTIAEGEIKAWNAWVSERGMGSNWHFPEKYGKKARMDDPHDRESGDENGDRTDAMDWLEDAGVLRARMVPVDRWTNTRVRHFFEVWCEWKRESGLLDFTDLIERCYQDSVMPALEYDALYIDEAQDMSALEMALALRWGRNARALVVCGDPYQNLYEWRGSDADVLLNLHQVAKAKRTLSQSYRVPREVHTVALAMLNEPMEDYVYQPRDFQGAVHYAADVDLNDPERIALSLQKDLERGGTVMLLAACAYQLNGIIAALRELGVPFWNPYRTVNGRWNPLSSRGKMTSSAGRVVAFSRVDEAVWNGSSRFWSADEIAAWSELIEAKVFTKKGDLTGLKGSDWEVSPDWIADRVKDPADLEAIFSGDLVWFNRHLLPSKAQTLQFPLRVARLQGVKVLEEQPRLIVGTIHCSPPDEPILTTDGYVPIGELVQGVHRLAGYDAKTNRLSWGGRSGPAREGIEWGYDFTQAVNHYHGDMLTLTTDRSRTRVTPNHRVRVRFNESFFDKWLVYLMRRGSWWRVGVCTSARQPYVSGGVGGRLATEKADAGWVLGVYETRREALVAEATIQAQYGMPSTTFQTAKGRALDQADLQAIHDAVTDVVSKRAVNLLADFGLDAEWPLYWRDGRKRNQHGYAFETIAANILSGYMDMPTVLDSFTSRESPLWLRVSVSKAPYYGLVCSLEVPPYHHYISGRAVVHNSVKGGESDRVWVFPDLSPSGYDDFLSDDAATRRQFYVAVTRAREELVLCGPSSSRAIEW